MINSSTITIAVVDDHDLVREGMCTMLPLIGFDVVITAINGKDFLAQMANANTCPDICLLDIDMPEMNGVQTASCIKAIWPGMKMLAHTFDSNDQEAMLRNGADACILKGCSLAELKEMLLELYASKKSCN